MRVVQYAALYQAFINLKIGVTSRLSANPPSRAPRLLVDELVLFYDRLIGASDEQLLLMGRPLITKALETLRPKADEAIATYEAEKN